MTKQTVLLAFDHKEDFGAFWHQLNLLGEQFQFTEAGAASTTAITELLKSEKFDCLILGARKDCNLEALKLVAVDTPVVVVLSELNQKLQQSIAESGAVACWTQEDVNAPMLSSCLSLLIERDGMQKELHRAMLTFERRDLDKEISSLLSWYYRTTVTADAFGLDGVKQSSPEQFKELVETFCKLIERNFDERTFKVAPTSSLMLHDLSQELGLLNAGPRDIIELYATALRAKLQGNTQLKGRAYAEVARALVLELMGYMVSHYRNLSKLALREMVNQPPQREADK